MKELDVLLEAFLEQHADALAAGRWPQFESLLSQDDDVLWRWVMQPDSYAEFHALLLVIMQCKPGSGDPSHRQ